MALTNIDHLPTLSRRPPDSNKGTFGRVLVTAGSRGMSGAAVLCGSAALRGGAGLVHLAIPREILPIVAQGNPCYMTIPLPQDGDGRLSLEAREQLLALGRANDVVAIGPGLGRSSDLSSMLAEFVEKCPVPMVLDADGLNAFADQVEALKKHAGPLVITPHPGEFARLLHVDVPTVQAQREDLARRFAGDFGVIVVLKGHGTIVTDGQRMYRNTTGNPGMATGGSGDVLTGLTAALIGQAKSQGWDLFQAVQLAVHVHGLAGDLARDELGEMGLIASDLVTYLPRTLQKVQV